MLPSLITFINSGDTDPYLLPFVILIIESLNLFPENFDFESGEIPPAQRVNLNQRDSVM